MRDDKLGIRWNNFSKQNPEIAAQICEASLEVCKIRDVETAVRSDFFRNVSTLLVEHHKELGLSVDTSEADLLRWITVGVFKRVLASERRH